MQLRFLCGLAAALGACAAWAQFPAEVLSKQKAAMSGISEHQPNARFLMTGDVLDRIYGAPMGGGFTAEQSVRSFVDKFADVFCADDGQFVFDRMQPMGFGGFTVGYMKEFIEGIPVEGGGVSVLVKQQIGNPIALVVNNGKCVCGPLPKARITGTEAVSRFRRTNPDYVLFGEPELVVFVAESTQHLAWKFTADNNHLEMPMVVTAFVDAVTGKTVHERNEVYEVDVNGSVKGWVSPGQRPDVATNPEVLMGLPHLRVQITGGNQAFTDANGNFTITNPGVAPVTVTAGLSGRWVNVINSAGASQTQSANVTPPGPADLIFGAGLTEQEVGQTNAYLQTNRVHDFVKAQNPAYPGVDIPLTCNVNIANTCNANFNSGTMSINFFASGGGCPNTAYTSVVHHEYGHFIINRAGTAQGGYGEGMSDTISCLLADDPCLGLEFNSPGCLRHAVNTIHYPENSGSAIHTAGMMVSGAFWETVLAFEATSGHANGLSLMRLYAVNSILLNPPGITPGLTIDVLTLDDDDLNLNNGTPHYDEIAEGFGDKGLFAPALQWLTFENQGSPTEFWHFDGNNDAGIPFHVKINENVNPPNVSTARLNVRINGGAWQAFPMVEIADPAFMYALADQPNCGDVLDWYVSCQDTQGHTSTFPSAGASGPFKVIVADSLQTILADTFETNQGWTVTNTAISTGAWVRADPNGTTQNGLQANPENDSGDAGAQCYFTGQGTVGGAVGTQDIDGGPTDLISPVIDLSAGDATIEYSRWFYSVGGVTDTFTVSVSNDGGTNWTTVENVSGVANSWVRRSFRVGALVAPTANVRVRFRATDNPNDSITEAGIDDFLVRRVVCN